MSTISADAAPVDLIARQPVAAPVNPCPRILVAEDDLEIRRLYLKIFMRAGYRVDTVANGQAAWNALESARREHCGYDLLITDNTMPEMTGVELVAKMRSARNHLPVIMASGTAPENVDGLCLAAILDKPVSLSSLSQTVDEVLHWSTQAVNPCGRRPGQAGLPPRLAGARSKCFN